jgi:hypothetical protein
MGSENEHSPPSRAELKAWSFATTPPTTFVAWAGTASLLPLLEERGWMEVRWCLANEERGIRHISDNIFICTVI